MLVWCYKPLVKDKFSIIRLDYDVERDMGRAIQEHVELVFEVNKCALIAKISSWPQLNATLAP